MSLLTMSWKFEEFFIPVVTRKDFCENGKGMLTRSYRSSRAFFSFSSAALTASLSFFSASCFISIIFCASVAGVGGCFPHEERRSENKRAKTAASDDLFIPVSYFKYFTVASSGFFSVCLGEGPASATGYPRSMKRTDLSFAGRSNAFSSAVFPNMLHQVVPSPSSAA